jgi:hypothetical protein
MPMRTPGLALVRNLGRAEPMYPLLPMCEECGRREPSPASTGQHEAHFPWCSKAPAKVRERYSDYQQRIDYRRAVRELGCTCSDRLAPHTHTPGCPAEDALDPDRDLTAYIAHLEDEHAKDQMLREAEGG